MSELPMGWVKATIGEIAESMDRDREPLNATERETCKGPYPYFGANGQVDSIDDYRYDGDYVLIAEDGGYFDQPERGVAYGARGKFWVNNHAHVLASREGVESRFLLHLLNATDWMPHVGGSTRLKLTAGSLFAVNISLPPTNEQRRIVAALDAIFARTRAARARLERLPALLDRLRQSILAAAFRGDLTKDWREAHPDVEPASKLLERIRGERRRRWEEELRKKGKDPRKVEYEEAAGVDSSTLNELPTGWAWASLGQITDIQGGITKNAAQSTGRGWRRVPYLRVANVQRGHLNLSEVTEIEASEADIASLSLRVGDILLNEGGDRDKLGRGWVWNGELPLCIHQNHVFRARVSSPYIDPVLVSLFTNSLGQAFFAGEGKQTTNLASISRSKLVRVPVAIPPAAERQELRRKVTEILAFISILEVRLGAEAIRLATLERAALAKAFRGELVPQDPADEPASVLLERIRAERAADPKPKRKGRAAAAAKRAGR